MPTLLRIDSSPLPNSISRELTKEFVAAWQLAHPDGAVIHRDVAANPPPLIDAEWIASNHTPDAARTPRQKALMTASDELIAELSRANEYVIGVAMHNFSIPAVLKLWIDQVARPGLTFAYTSGGPKGLLLGKKATILGASGGVYAAGTPAAAVNFMEPYLQAVLGLMGVTDTTVVTAGGAARLMSGAIDRSTFLRPTLEQVRALAA